MKPQFLSSIDFTGIVLGFQISPQKETENSIQVSVQVRKLELHSHNQSNIQDNFWRATDALHDCNVVEQCHAETTCEAAYSRTHLPIILLSVFKEN
jgi:hypothetical protein